MPPCQASQPATSTVTLKTAALRMSAPLCSPSVSAVAPRVAAEVSASNIALASGRGVASQSRAIGACSHSRTAPPRTAITDIQKAGTNPCQR